MNIAKFLRTAFFIEHLRWLLLITVFNRRYFEKQLLQNSKDNFTRYEGLCPVIKTKIHCGFPNGILRNFRAASFENNFGGLLLKRKQRRRTRSDPCGFRFSLFPGHLFIYQAMKQCTFSTNFCIADLFNLDYVIHFYIADLFNLDYVIHFYIPKKGLSSSVFIIKVLAVNIRLLLGKY